MTARTRVLFVGVGGQGVLSAARLLGEAAVAAGCDAILGQHHGMSQRGGSVESSVVIGPARASLIGRGQADVVAGFEPMETLRAIDRMTERTLVVANRDRISTAEMSRLGEPYPDLRDLFCRVEAVAPRTQAADLTHLAREAGDPRAVGVVLLGWIAALGGLPFGEQPLRTAIEHHYHGAARRTNLRALALGLNRISSARDNADSS